MGVVKDAAEVFGTFWHKLSEFVRTHSIWISTAVNGWIVLGKAFEWIAWTDNQQDAVQSFVLILTGVFMAKTNVASTRVEVIKDKAHAAGVLVGTGTGDGGRYPPAA